MGICWPSTCKRQNVRRRIVLIMIGLDNAGKTQTVNNLLGQNGSVLPTVGFKAVNLIHRDTPVTIYDLGGSPNFRQIWPQYYSEVHGVIFVIDSSDYSRLDECKMVLEEVLSHDRISGKPILVLANKQDKKEALDDIDIVEKLNIEPLVNRYRCPTLVESYTAVPEGGGGRKTKINEGLHRGYLWLLNYIIRRYGDLNLRVQTDIHAELERRSRQTHTACHAAQTERGAGVSNTATQTGFANPKYESLSRNTDVPDRGRGRGRGDRNSRSPSDADADADGLSRGSDANDHKLTSMMDAREVSEAREACEVCEVTVVKAAPAGQAGQAQAQAQQTSEESEMEYEGECSSATSKPRLSPLFGALSDKSLPDTSRVELHAWRELSRLGRAAAARRPHSSPVGARPPPPPQHEPQHEPEPYAASVEHELTKKDKVLDLKEKGSSVCGASVGGGGGGEGLAGAAAAWAGRAGSRPSSASNAVRRQLELAPPHAHKRRLTLSYYKGVGRNRTCPEVMTLFHFDPNKSEQLLARGDFVTHTP